ncbi:leucine-rich repeat domain-containing protein [Pseudoflavonifractor sp. MSJ-30]|uniref:leucine-rich repeat domain-containing protein n=1 Tax=Pseudoflavonifractor sp. MSJ-30 TaxID=2841525 RepID=UPI001C100E0E|nr:leucine-rich repeat domain-containing protein [Pseudoflavonifractor sp. MSJ-30]MBU5452047.1 leucine-rich repeat domain-containing protein [Pseudoflavonifractor sp. MSJ-30]
MKKLIHFLVPLLMIVLVIASIGWYLFVYDRAFTRDLLLQQARDNDLKGNTSLSSWFYNLAYGFSGQDENVAIELANQYKASGNYTKAEVTLSKAIRDGATKELYIALCKTYVEQDKILDAVSMLANIPNASIKAELEAMRPAAPQADYPSGYYSQYISVTLSSSEGTTLYYTTDGDYPSIADEPYSAPIELPLGESQVYAVSVADNGLVSPVTILGYTIGGVIEPVIFMDASMEQAIRAALGYDQSHVLYTNDLWQITELEVPSDAMTLEDLIYLTYLENLTVNGRNMSNLQDFAGLNHLKKLDLSSCRFPADGLKTIASLPHLKELNLSNCSLSTLSGLENAESMEILDISNNTIRNLEPLSNMSALSELYLQHNAVANLTVVGGLPELTVLDVSYNALTSIAPLTGNVRLTKLNAANNQIGDVSAAASLPMLAELNLDYNSLTDISGLSGCASLKTLTVSNNQLNSIDALSGMSTLERLDFSYNSVSSLPDFGANSAMQVIDGSYNALESIDSIAKMADISYIYMDYNKLTSVDALADCFHLVQVNVYGNEIPDVSALTEHDILVNYDPTVKE